MKKITNRIAIVLLLTMISCYKKSENEIRQNTKVESPEMTDREFMEKLIKVDFFKYAEPTVSINLIDSLEIYNENTNKFAPIDAEELAEFSFEHFVPQLTKMLAKRNIVLQVNKTKETETMHQISINGQNIILYSRAELEDGKFWKAAQDNFFRKLNQLLAEKKSDEQFYLLNEGNDLATLLLTNSQYELFRVRYQSEVSEIPYKP